jgi:hypothetical protein
MPGEFESSTRKPLVDFGFGQLAPPSNLYVDEEDFLFVEHWTSNAAGNYEVGARLLRADGTIVPILERITPLTSDRSPQTTIIHLSEGFLLSVQALALGANIQRGQLYVTILVARGAVPTGFARLTEGYVDGTGCLAWPPGKQESSVSGRGVIRSITGTNPAAGAEVSETVPTNARWRPIAVRLTLVTDATVSSRVVTVTLDDGATVYLQVPSAVAQTASLTNSYNLGADMIQIGAITTAILIPLPAELYMPAGHRIRSLTTNLQAGDNYGAPQLLVEEWIEE